MRLKCLFFKNANQWNGQLLCLFFGLVLMLAPILCFSQEQLPTPARPRPGQPADKSEFPGVETPRVDVLPLAGEAPPDAVDISLILQDIVFEGSTVYSTVSLREFYADFIGKQITLAQIFVIANQVQQKYRSDGYMLTRVVVPPQSVDDGIFKIQVIEGYIAEVDIDGEVPVKQRIQGYLESPQKPYLIDNDVNIIHKRV